MERQRIAKLEQEETEDLTKTNGKYATLENKQGVDSQDIDLHDIVTNAAQSVQGITEEAEPANGRHD